MNTFPESLKVAVLSTAHLTTGDMTQLKDKSDGNLICDEFEYGWWIWLGSEEPPLAPFSPEFCKLYHAAKAAGFDWLKMDCDGLSSEAFPIMQI